MSSDQCEENERAKAIDCLQECMDRAEGSHEGWRQEVFVGQSVGQAIVDVVLLRKVDLVAMYTHDRKGLAKFIMGSIAKELDTYPVIGYKVMGALSAIMSRRLRQTTETLINQREMSYSGV